MRSVLKKGMCAILAVAIMSIIHIVPSYAETDVNYLESLIVDKVNSNIMVSCRFPSGQENRIATVILAKNEIAPNEALDISNGKIENIMVTPIEYNGDMNLTIGYDPDVRNYVLYVICDGVRLEKTVNLSEHLANFNLSDKYGALASDTTKGRLAERLEELPEEVSVVSPVMIMVQTVMKELKQSL